jgi:peptidoglycan/xylan/chitin deacetylase (PgdA/CDA1 family)
MISFTFDDFPRSALFVGGAVLKSFAACGTFYAAPGLMNQVNALGEQFCAQDIVALLADGHELGSHTYSHSSCRAVPLTEFEQDVKKGREAVEHMTGLPAGHFSYPFGHATFGAKLRIGSRFSSCRGIAPGINESPADLNLLRANSLYSASFDPDAIARLIAMNEKLCGWLIFYTHDIREAPSEFGCTPNQFEGVVKLAVRQGGRILTVDKAIAAAAGVARTRQLVS